MAAKGMTMLSVKKSGLSRTFSPGTEEPVNKREFQEGLNMAEDVFNWAKRKLKK